MRQRLLHVCDTLASQAEGTHPKSSVRKAADEIARHMRASHAQVDQAELLCASCNTSYKLWLDLPM